MKTTDILNKHSLINIVLVTKKVTCARIENKSSIKGIYKMCLVII